ncbi:MAG: DUF2244 domain-containing protein [Gammaproteobacteria bacterium]|jgi:uncharacterized membrane protein
MISELQAGGDGGGRTFVVMPNQAMSWRNLVEVYAGITGAVLLIAAFFWMQGLPLVLPFSGLELLLLGAVLYITAWNSDWREVIIVGDDLVSVETGRYGPVSHCEFQRPWAKVIILRPGGWYPSRLIIRSHGRQIEIGRFLNEQERQGLAELLSAALKQRAGRESTNNYGSS